MRKSLSTKRMVYLSLLIAIDLILTRFFSYQIPGTSARIGLGFLPQVLAGYLFGPLWSAISAGLSDFIGAVLFPKGEYFIGYTITAIIRGFIYGYMLKNCPLQTKPLVLKTTLTVFAIIIVDVFLNSVWDMMIFVPNYNAALLRKVISPSLYINAVVKLTVMPFFIRIISRVPAISKFYL